MRSLCRCSRLPLCIRFLRCRKSCVQWIRTIMKKKKLKQARPTIGAPILNGAHLVNTRHKHTECYCPNLSEYCLSLILFSGPVFTWFWLQIERRAGKTFNIGMHSTPERVFSSTSVPLFFERLTQLLRTSKLLQNVIVFFLSYVVSRSK